MKRPCRLCKKLCHRQEGKCAECRGGHEDDDYEELRTDIKVVKKGDDLAKRILATLTNEQKNEAVMKRKCYQ